MFYRKTWLNVSTPRARQIVRSVLATAARPEIGLHTHEIFERAITKYPARRRITKPTPLTLGMHKRYHRPIIPVPDPPQPYHPIRSMRYLKRVVLAEMQEAGEVDKVRIWKGGVIANGNSQVFIHSKVLRKTDTAIHKMTEDQMWCWKLLPDYESRQANYPDPPRRPHKRSSQTASTHVPPRSRTADKDQ
ncbi:hypothetical protein F5I97DRAFT_1926193 [Phlebopus sp. FC_14]|nr:hypothetical protein F5I97DRAFT_1926193 [Phlebopus sp. FC_14]